MRKKLVVITVVSCVALTVLAQDEPGAVEPPAPVAGVAPGVEGISPEELQRQIERQQEERKRQIKDKKQELVKKKEELGAAEAGLAELLNSEDRIKKAVTRAEARKAKAYEDLSVVDNMYQSRMQEEKNAYSLRIREELQAEYDAAYAKQLSEHERDTAFINRNKWTGRDMDELDLQMDAIDSSRRLKIFGKRNRRVAGVFPTLNLDSEAVVWRSVPAEARFTATIQRDNPFIAEVKIHPGMNSLLFASTNASDYEVCVFICKHFEEKEPGQSRFELIGVAWPVDIERPVCLQVAKVPVFVPVEMPEKKAATEETAAIAEQLEAWEFLDAGWNQKLQDAKDEVEKAKEEADLQRRMLPRVQERIRRRRGSYDDRIIELEEEVEDLDSLIASLVREMEEARQPGYGVPEEQPPAGEEEGGLGPDEPLYDSEVD